MTPPYRHLFVFVCFFIFMYLNLDTFEAAKKEADEREDADPNAPRKIVHLIRHGQAQHNVDGRYVTACCVVLRCVAYWFLYCTFIGMDKHNNVGGGMW